MRYPPLRLQPSAADCGRAMRARPRIAHAAVRIQVVRPDRHLAVAARDIQHIGRPGQPGDPAAQRGQQPPPLLDRHVEPRGPRRGIELVQVVRLHPRGQHGAEQRLQRRGAVVDAAQQHRLAEQRDARAPARGAARRARPAVNSRAWLACTTSQSGFSVAIAVGQRVGHPVRIGHRHARVDAQHVRYAESPTAPRRSRPAGAATASADRRRSGSPRGSPDGRRTRRRPPPAPPRSARRRPARHARGGSRSGNRPGRPAAASAARGRGSDAPRP